MKTYLTIILSYISMLTINAQNTSSTNQSLSDNPCNLTNKPLNEFISDAVTKYKISSKTWGNVYNTYKTKAKRNDFYCIEKVGNSYMLSTDSGFGVA